MPDNRSLVEKIIGMLGSDSDGERANAAGKLMAIARERKITLHQLFQQEYGRGSERVVIQEKIVYRERPAAPATTYPPYKTADASTAYTRSSHKSYEQKMTLVLRQFLENPAGKLLTDWEVTFIRDILPRLIDGMEPTAKQCGAMSKIWRKFSINEAV